jgi:hypothetical protein
VAFERLGLEYRHERFSIRKRYFRYLKERTMSIPTQDEREKPHTENNKPQTIIKLIHNILSGQVGKVSKNAYLDTIVLCNIQRIKYMNVLFQYPLR